MNFERSPPGRVYLDAKEAIKKSFLVS